jgi:isopenicillin-N epimerase
VIPRDRPGWALDPGVVFLNHGSFGACPVAVLETQRAWRDRMEAEPVAFLARELEGHLDAARAVLAAFVGADPAGLAFVPNATSGVNAVLGSLRFAPGDELLTTDHEYNATVNAMRRAAERYGATVVVAPVPFPIAGPEEAVAAVLAEVTPRTRLAVISHVTSPTALVLPIERLVAELSARGVETLVDGAHAPGMVPLALDALGAAWYTGNAHKWLCAPKGAAFLWTRADRRAETRPLVTSHGANDPRTDRSRYHLEFDWTGTADPTAWLAIPAAIETVGAMDPAGWPGVMAANRALAIAARDVLATALGVEPPAPDPMLGAMAALPVPWLAGRPDADGDALGAALLAAGFEVPVTAFPVPAARPGDATGRAAPTAHLVRVSAQRYDVLGEYEALATAIRRCDPRHRA